jgi:hypothetical protein
MIQRMISVKVSSWNETATKVFFELAGTFEQNYGASTMSVRQRDVAAAVKGAVAAGVEVARVEVDKEGRIVIVAGKPSESAAEVSLLDAWMAMHAR